MARATPSSDRRARVLLVEDDASIGHFVAMAFEDLPIELVSCPTLAIARRELAVGEPALILLDMMLPDGSGLHLLQSPHARAAAGAACWVVFSAGLSPAVAQALPSLGVHRVLAKPVALKDLLACVADALAGCSARAGAGGTAATTGSRHPSERNDASGVDLDGSAEAEDAAVRQYFEGDRPLFESMKWRTLQQLPLDQRAAEAVLATRNVGALQRVAHSLKTVLRMLGHPRLADRAQALEQAAADQASDSTLGQLWGQIGTSLPGAGTASSTGNPNRNMPPALRR